MASISHTLIANFKQIETEGISYLTNAKAKGTAVDAAVLRQYEHQRQSFLTDSIRQLRSSLSQSSWQGMHSYVNDVYRKQIHAVKATRR